MPVTSPAKKTALSIDYPRRNERVSSDHYSIRITAPADPSAGERVEVSIDDGAFAPCRFAAGHWWYDWTGYGSGEHQVVARMSAGGRMMKAARRFVVEPAREGAAA